MQHAIKQSSDISSMYTQGKREYDNQMDSDTIIMLKDDQNNIQVRESTCQVEWYTVVSACMWSDQSNHDKIRISVLNKVIRSIINNPACQCLKRIHQWNTEKKHGIRILNQYKSIIIINMSMSQVKTNTQACTQWYRELSMCNQEMGTHWSSYQSPCLLHSKFKLDPLNNPQWSRHFVDPAFRLLDAFPTRWRARFLFYLKNWFLLIKKMTWSRHLFLFYF